VLRIEQPLWTGGLITSQIALAQARADRAQALLTEAQQTILRDVATAYLEALRLESRLKVSEVNEAEHRRLYELIMRRAAAEVSPMTDATQGAVRLHQATNERLQIARQLQATRHALSQLLGREPKDLASPAQLTLAGLSREQVLEASLAFSPERRRLQAELLAAEQEIEIVKAQVKPKLVVGYLTQNNPGSISGGTSSRAYLALQVQPGAGLSSLSAVESAIAQRQAAADAIDVHERALRQEIFSAWSEIDALELQLEPIRSLVDGSGEIMASYLRQFQVGRKNWLDVLNAQREKTQASYSLTDIESPLKLLRVKLLVLMGTVNHEQVQLVNIQGNNG
jgi:adhesin transport system outer membrane protein